MCPFVEAADPRCGKTLTLDNLTRALSLCACEYGNCPVYREIQSDVQHDSPRDEHDTEHLLVAG